MPEDDINIWLIRLTALKRRPCEVVARNQFELDLPAELVKPAGIWTQFICESEPPQWLKMIR
jgi:hypothetical protein